MRAMDAGSVDVVVTDPPYRVISGGNTGPERPTGMLSENNGKNFEHNDIRFRDWMHDLFRVLRDPGHAYIMVNFLNLEEALRQTRLAGFEVHNLLVWKKNNVTPNRWYMKNCEYVIFARKGRAFSINDKGAKTVHDFENRRGVRSHPCEKPVDLMQFYIENSTQPGDVVFDPFAGSGSTGIEARACGRDFIGVEIDPEYVAIAARRLGVMPGVVR